MRRPRTLQLTFGLALLAACRHTGTPAEPEPARVCVLRHAESYLNLEAPPAELSASEREGLTENGRGQARRAQAALALGAEALVLTSPVTRAVETATIVAAGRPMRTSAALHYLEAGRTAEQALAELRELIRDTLAETPAPDPLVLVTHSDLSALLLGEPEGTPLPERARAHALETGTFRCIRWRR